jgi:thiosulfate dehydrogenase
VLVVARAGFVVVVMLACAGCDDPIARGKKLFDDPAIAGSATNYFSCALCHDAQPMRADSPGYPLEGVFLRPSFWGGEVLDPLSGTDVCVTDFMGGRALDRAQSDVEALSAYLQSISDPKKVSPDLSAAQPYTVPPTISADTVAGLPPGDATRGATRWNAACASCHGEPGTGQGRITQDTSIVPNSVTEGGEFPDPTVQRTVVVEKIRHGKYFGIGGKMPPFSYERLDDSAVSDLVVYLQGFGLPGPQ